MADTEPSDRPGRDSDVASPDTRRRRADADENYSRILEAASAVLRREPAASIERIASDAGVGRATIYRHFRDRGELLQAVRQQALDAASAHEPEGALAPGHLARLEPAALVVRDVFDQVPPCLLGEQIVAEAQRLTGASSAAVYVVAIDGSALVRAAGPPEYPPYLDAPMAVGPEIPAEGLAALRRQLAEQLPGSAVVPLYLRGRVIGLLLAMGPDSEEPLREIAREGAAAIALADRYTDRFQMLRRRETISPASEIQHSLLPPRILWMNGAAVAGNIAPAHDATGVWFDYAGNPDGGWLGVCCAAGTGPTAAALSSIVLGAFRAARRQGLELEDAALLMHAVVYDTNIPDASASAIVGRWHGPSSVFRWIGCGHPPPLLVTATGQLKQLDAPEHPALGAEAREATFAVSQRRVLEDERLILLSDGVLTRQTDAGQPLGLRPIEAAVNGASASSAAATVKVVIDTVLAASAEPLAADAAVVVLTPSAPPDPAARLQTAYGARIPALWRTTTNSQRSAVSAHTR